jgi:molybdate transport system substrate-binding protein
MWRRLAFISSLILLTASCQREEARQNQVMVAAAADLKFALDEMAGEFQAAHPELKVRAIYGSSGNFQMQIVQGASFDLYLSADCEYPRLLVAGGDADGDSLFHYGVGALVLWVRADSPLNVEEAGMQVLLDPRVRKVAIAQPEHAPYGRAALAALRHAGVYESVRGKLVLGENVAQAASFAESGNVDLAVIARSLALAPALRARGRYWEIPSDHFPALLQAGVIPKLAGNPAGAAKFSDWMRSARGRDLLMKHGFEMPTVP